MDINRYEAFVAAVDTQSMSGAAKKLGYTPSGIIRLINALEGELGFPLLARSSTGVAPTDEGLKLLPLFREMSDVNMRIHQTSARIRGLAEGTLTVGALFSLASRWLPSVIRAYEDRFPGVKVNIVGGSDVHLRSLLEQHAIDCALLHSNDDKLNWVPLGTQELVAWLPANSPLTRHQSILLAELDGQPYIRIHPEGETFAERLMRQRNIEPDIRFTATDCYTAFSMVGAGLGICLCCNGIADEWMAKGRVAIRPLSPQRYLDFGIGTLQTPSPSPAVEEFINVAKGFSGTWPKGYRVNL